MTNNGEKVYVFGDSAADIPLLVEQSAQIVKTVGLFPREFEPIGRRAKRSPESSPDRHESP